VTPRAAGGATAAPPAWRGARLARGLALALGAVLLVLLAASIVFGIIFVGDGTMATAPVSDFTAFWVAGRMALAGQAAEAYDRATFVAAASALMGQPPAPGLGWLNPPSLLLLLGPLALLPYRWAWLAWFVLCVVVLGWAVHRVLPRPGAVMAVLLAPAAVLCAALGQNGFLTAALLGLAMLWLDRRPLAAGICIGLLTFKPQFGLVLPLLLLASRRWVVFAAAGGATLALVAAAAAAFGIEAWRAFLLSLPANAGHSLIAAPDALYFHQSIHAALRAAGLPAVAAWAAHAAAGAVALAIAWRCWRAGDGPGEARAVATFAACMLITPYGFMYDQVLLGVAAAFLARAAARGPRLPGEVPLAMIACLVPGVAFVAYVPIAAPAAWMLMLALALRRASAERHPPDQNRSPPSANR
jgi:hypothetical protein